MFPISLRKILYWLAAGLGLAWLYAVSHILYTHDLSLESIDIMPKAGSAGYVSKPFVYVVSYADGAEVFLRNQNALGRSVINRNVDFTLSYRKHHLDADFVKRNAKILDYSRGAGYWVWKPWIILRTLETVPENSIVIYLDSGFVATASLTPLIDLALQHDIILIKHDDLGTNCGMITQRETLQKMECDTESCHQSPHIWSAISVYRNTPAARAFVKKWLDWCQDPVCVLEHETLHHGTPQEKSTLTPCPGFVHHHHDESILSVLYAKEPQGKHLLQLADLGKMRVVFWHHRHPKGELYSVLPFMHRFKVNKWERWCYWLYTWQINKLKVIAHNCTKN